MAIHGDGNPIEKAIIVPQVNKGTPDIVPFGAKPPVVPTPRPDHVDSHPQPYEGAKPPTVPIPRPTPPAGQS